MVCIWEIMQVADEYRPQQDLQWESCKYRENELNHQRLHDSELVESLERLPNSGIPSE
jgi:hypothetical protein